MLAGMSDTAVHSRRSLAPREHGAYGQFALPLVTALAQGRPGLVSGLLVVGAVAAFVAHEPLLVLLGHRGARLREEVGPRARRVGTVALVLALGCGLGALALASPSVRLAAVVPVGLTALLVPLVLRREEKTAVGELLAAAALSGASLPVAVAGGVPPVVAAIAWATWVAAFWASTASVRYLIARHKQRHEPLALPVLFVTTLGPLVALPATRMPLAATPLLFLSWALFLRPPSPRHLRRVGWMLVAMSVTTAVLLLLLAPPLGIPTP